MEHVADVVCPLTRKNIDNEYVNLHLIISSQKYRFLITGHSLHVPCRFSPPYIILYNPNDKSLETKNRFILIIIEIYQFQCCFHSMFDQWNYSVDDPLLVGFGKLSRFYFFDNFLRMDVAHWVLFLDNKRSV